MKIIGTKKDDNLAGTTGDDILKGGKGDDFIRSGGDGLDIMKGGDGADTFVVSVDQFVFIRDFEPGKDHLILVDDSNPQPNGATPLDPGDFGPLVTVTNGVIEYQGSPVVAVGDVGVGYGDLLLN